MKTIVLFFSVSAILVSCPVSLLGQFSMTCVSCYAPGQPVHCDTKTNLSAFVCDPEGNAVQPCVRHAFENEEFDACPTPFREVWHPYPWIGTVIEQVIGQTGQDCKNDRQKDCVIRYKCLCDWRIAPSGQTQLAGQTQLVCVDSNQVFGTRSYQEWYTLGAACNGTK